MLISDEIYEKIIEGHIEKAETIRVITGYSSAKFIERVANILGGRNLEVYIGMATRGIPKEDHVGYLALMSTYPNIKIFYQVKEPCTHIKLIEFIASHSEGSYVFIGSANFSEAGYLAQRELMIKSVENVNELFLEQASLSILANDIGVLTNVPIVGREVDSIVESNSEELPLDIVLDKEDSIADDGDRPKVIITRHVGYNPRNKIDRYYNEFEVPLYLLSDLDSTHISGEIIFPPRFNQLYKFPEEEPFRLYFGDINNPNVVEARLAGQFGKKLCIPERALLELLGYLDRRLANLDKVTVGNLRNIDKRHLKIERFNEIEYYIFKLI